MHLKNEKFIYIFQRLFSLIVERLLVLKIMNNSMQRHSYTTLYLDNVKE